MDLSITGKKMNTPLPTKKTAELNSPLKPQPKVVPKKTNPINIKKT